MIMAAFWRIEVASRFVGQDDPRVVEKRASHCRSLTFACAELSRAMSQTINQSELVQQLFRSSPRHRRVGWGSRQHILHDIEIGQQMEHLKDVADIFGSETCPFR